MTPQLKEAITAVATEFAGDFAQRLIQMLNNLPLSALTGVDYDSVAAAKPRNAAAPKAAKTGAGGRRMKRTDEEMQAIIDSIVGVLKTASEPMRSEQLQQVLKLDKFDIQRPLLLALERNIVKKEGQKRSTAYFLRGGAGHAAVAKKPAAKPKKAAPKRKVAAKAAPKAAPKKKAAARKPAKRRGAHVEVVNHAPKTNSSPAASAEATPA